MFVIDEQPPVEMDDFASLLPLSRFGVSSGKIERRLDRDSSLFSIDNKADRFRIELLLMSFDEIEALSEEFKTVEFSFPTFNLLKLCGHSI